MNKADKIILCFLLIVSIVMVPVAILAQHHSNQAAERALEEWKEERDEAEREDAIRDLSVLRGRISEIKMLSFYWEIPDDVLQEELDDIISSQEFKNPYLTNSYLIDFTFTVPEKPSSIGELCDILISQIYDQIYTLEFGTEDA